MKRLFVFIWFIVGFLNIQGQNKTVVHYTMVDQVELPNFIQQDKLFNTQQKAESSLKTNLQKLIDNGFIEASIDSFFIQDEKMEAFLFLGKKYILNALENGNLNKEILRKLNFDESHFYHKTFSFEEIEKFQKEVLRYYESNGFPFVQVYLDSFSIENRKVRAKIYAQPNELFIVDTLIIEGNSNTNSRFLQNYLSIKTKDYYNVSKIEEISKKLAQLSFLEEKQKAEIYFENGLVKIILYIDKQKTNQFDALLGLAPNSSLTESGLNLTGDINLHLFNSFGVGEEIFFDFKQLKPGTQNLDISFNYPFLLNLPFGTGADFSLFKNDTSFINLDSKVAVHYQFNGADYIELFFQNKTSNVLNYDTARIRQTEELPEILDLNDNKFGLALHFQKLDYLLNPRKGYVLHFSGSAGMKRIKENGTLLDIESNIYNTLNLQSINFTLGSLFEYHIPLLKRHSFLLKNESMFFVSKNILDNEKFRIGGASLLRGFDENEIFTPFYSLFSLEYHFLLSKNTYFYTFGDLALVEDSRFESGVVDLPFGFGTGVSLETKGGVFSLSYALGKQLNNKIDIRNGKIHFGYINIF